MTSMPTSRAQRRTPRVAEMACPSCGRRVIHAGLDSYQVHVMPGRTIITAVVNRPADLSAYLQKVAAAAETSFPIRHAIVVVRSVPPSGQPQPEHCVLCIHMCRRVNLSLPRGICPPTWPPPATLT